MEILKYMYKMAFSFICGIFYWKKDLFSLQIKTNKFLCSSNMIGVSGSVGKSWGAASSNPGHVKHS